MAMVQLAFLPATELRDNNSFFCNSAYLVVPSYPTDFTLRLVHFDVAHAYVS